MGDYGPQVEIINDCYNPRTQSPNSKEVSLEWDDNNGKKSERKYTADDVVRAEAVSIQTGFFDNDFHIVWRDASGRVLEMADLSCFHVGMFG